MGEVKPPPLDPENLQGAIVDAFQRLGDVLERVIEYIDNPQQ